MTPVENRVFWTDPGAHSAIKLLGQAVRARDRRGLRQARRACCAAHGCPWGWVRIIDIRRRDAPGDRRRVPAAVNEPEICASQPPDRDHVGSFSRPQPDADAATSRSSPGTAPGSRRWRSRDPTQPRSAAQFVPEPLPVRPDRGPGAQPGPGQGRHVELPDHQGRPDLRGRHPQRALHPALPRPASSARLAASGSSTGTRTPGDAHAPRVILRREGT